MTVFDFCSVQNALLVFPSLCQKLMTCLLSLRRFDGKCAPAGEAKVVKRLVDIWMDRNSGYRVARARCCIGGAEVAELWEPALVRIDALCLVIQGFEKTGSTAVAQEWVIQPYVAEVGSFTARAT